MNLLRNISIGNKTQLLIAIGLIFMIGIGGISYYYIERMDGYAEKMFTDEYLPTLDVYEISVANEKGKALSLQMVIAERDEIAQNE